MNSRRIIYSKCNNRKRSLIYNTDNDLIFSTHHNNHGNLNFNSNNSNCNNNNKNKNKNINKNKNKNRNKNKNINTKRNLRGNTKNNNKDSNNDTCNNSNNNKFIRSWKRTIFQDTQDTSPPKKRQRTNGSFKADNFRQITIHPQCIINAPNSNSHNNANLNQKQHHQPITHIHADSEKSNSDSYVPPNYTQTLPDS